MLLSIKMYQLYSTDGCHLCEDAAAIIHAHSTIEFEVIDIVFSEALMAKFATSIPVLSDGKNLLYWPFDAASLKQFIS